MADMAQKAKFIYNSNRLDGVHIPYEVTLELLTQPPDPLDESVDIPAMDGEKAYDRAVVLSHANALFFVEKLAQKTPVAEADIREVHRRLMENVIISNGEYRECRLNPRGIPPLDPSQIPARMRRIVAILNQGFERARDKALLAWQVHHEFIYAHPFIEGNGRTARLLLQLVRFRAGLDLEVVPFAERERYFRSIADYGKKLAAALGQEQPQASASGRIAPPG
jgi:Fic family protein